MMPFWCACWTALADLREQLQPLRHRQVVLVAEVGDPYSAHQFHDEEGPARICSASVKNLGDVRVLQHRQHLALGVETGDDLPRVHP
jgi:hypothetical protein